MSLDKLVPSIVLQIAIGVNYAIALLGAYLSSLDLVLLSIFSIACCAIPLWIRKKQKDDKD